jgi:HEAT repeat protein
VAEGTPSLADLQPFLDDPDDAVRRAGVATLTVEAPTGVGEALVDRLRDPAGPVRTAAAAALRELVEVLPATDSLGAALRAGRDAPDPGSRAAVLDVLRALRLGDRELFRTSLADPAVAVRLQAVRGLVSLDDLDGILTALGDEAREVRVAVAHAVGQVGGEGAAEGLFRLTSDPEALVRAAALEAVSGLSDVDALWDLCAAGTEAPEWQVRVGAVRGLAHAPSDVAVRPLARAVDDPSGDVRKATVISLTGHATDPDAAEALERATKDIDADVRGYARRALR